MTDLRQAAEMALEKLEFFAHMKSVSEDTMRLITALREALENEPQEPVAWVCLDLWKAGKHWPDDCFGIESEEGMTPLYTAPPKREFIGLTDEEIDQAANNAGFGHINIAREIEAKLKEKNNG